MYLICSAVLAISQRCGFTVRLPPKTQAQQVLLRRSNLEEIGDWNRKMNKKKVLQLAKGFRGRAKNCIRIARERVEKALQYSYRDRRNKKRDMRGLWIQRINAGTRLHSVRTPCHFPFSLFPFPPNAAAVVTLCVCYGIVFPWCSRGAPDV